MVYEDIDGLKKGSDVSKTDQVLDRGNRTVEIGAAWLARNVAKDVLVCIS